MQLSIMYCKILHPQSCLMFALLLSCLAGCICVASTKDLRKSKSQTWSKWTPCSVTCGEGKQSRVSMTSPRVETRSCYKKFCPSYLSWPRIHFSGKFVADVSTLNNMACNYDNKHFTSTGVSRFNQRQLTKNDATFTSYGYQQSNWNSMGSGHFYFVGTRITSICTNPNNCSTTAAITKSVLREAERAQMVTPHPYEQTACEIWGLTIQIPGVLEGRYKPACNQVEGNRCNKVLEKSTRGYSYCNVGRFKSVLRNVTWHNEFHKQLFHNATTLSITMVIDYFNQISRSGSVSGTIGLTSSDDPLETVASRVMEPLRENMQTPFYLYKHKKIVCIDMAGTLPAYNNGTFKSRGIFLAVRVHCKFPYLYATYVCYNSVVSAAGDTYYILQKLTTSFLDAKGDWYKLKGGILDISLSHLPSSIFRLLRNHRVSVLRKVERRSHRILVEEPKHGINTGIFSSAVERLNVNQSAVYKTYASKYGKPLKNVHLSIGLLPGREICDCGFKSCTYRTSEPADALQINSVSSLTGASGINSHRVTLVRDPGSNGCGIDGQIYTMFTKLKYNILGQTVTYCNPTGGSDCNISLNNQLTQVRTFNEVEVPDCPGWLDISEIFEQYYNLYPVMWRNGIIDLHAYDEVKQKARLIKTAMFELKFSHPRYMPASRDLSLSKQKLIWNWMQCGMQFDTRNETRGDCSTETVKEGIVELKDLLQKIVMLELATIPPYFTAWLSLKTEAARNYEIARRLKSIFSEEMLHMSLAANILNAIGGTVNLTNINELPSYPTPIGSGSFYDISANILLPLERFSIPLVRDVFSNVEIPASMEERKELLRVAQLWKILFQFTDEKPTTKMALLLEELAESDEIEEDPLQLASKPYDSVEELEIRSWSAIYEYAKKRLDAHRSSLASTIGGLYGKLLMHIILLESCAKLYGLDEGSSSTNTIFVGNFSKQLNISSWYDPSQKFALNETIASMQAQMKREELEITHSQSSFVIKNPIPPAYAKNSNLSMPLFPVMDLRTAIQAVVEIVYQGEGSSPCSAYRKFSPTGRTLTNDNSHYVMFREIVRGRSLTKVNVSMYPPTVECLEMIDFKCPEAPKKGEGFCFVGEEVPFDKSGVWPIIPNPGRFSYAKGTDAQILDDQFNLQYTRLLWCLEKVFGGFPADMKNCMSDMYDLVITGKELVQTPVGRVAAEFKDMRNDCRQCHATPSWQFKRDLDYRAGLYLDV